MFRLAFFAVYVPGIYKKTVSTSLKVMRKYTYLVSLLLHTA